MEYSIIIAITLFIIYMAAYIKRFGVPASFSDTYKEIKPKWPFYVVLVYFGLSLAIEAQTLAFLISCGFLCLVAAAPQFWVKRVRIVHIIGAAGSVVAALAGLIFDFQNYIIAALIVLIYIVFALKIVKIRNNMFYIEMAIFFLIALAVFIH